jgi:replicative DNA helicase
MTPELDLDHLLQRAVLAAVLAAPWHFPKLTELLVAEDFSYRPYREMFVALSALDSRGLPADAVLLVAELQQSRKLSARGPNAEMVFELLRMPVLAPHLPAYCAALLEQGRARKKALELLQSSNVGGPA